MSRRGKLADGAPDRIRTCDLCLRRAALYPAELRVREGGWYRKGWWVSTAPALGAAHGRRASRPPLGALDCEALGAQLSLHAFGSGQMGCAYGNKHHTAACHQRCDLISPGGVAAS